MIWVFVWAGMSVLQACLIVFWLRSRHFWFAAMSGLAMVVAGLDAYAAWMDTQPLTDVGECYQGMTLPARSECHFTVKP